VGRRSCEHAARRTSTIAPRRCVRSRACPSGGGRAASRVDRHEQLPFGRRLSAGASNPPRRVPAKPRSWRSTSATHRTWHPRG
jgi:hypothetical protein